MPDGSGVQARINASEQDAQVACDNVGDGFGASGLEFLACRGFVLHEYVIGDIVVVG